MTVAEYNKCVDEYADRVFRFIFKNLKDEDRSKDIVQDSFEKLWIKAAEVSYEKVRSYLFTTAYHTMIDQIRKDNRMDDFEKIKEQDFSHRTQYSDLSELLDQAIRKLPEIQKSVILLRDYEGYSYKEIADITELSEDQVKVYIYRGRMFLKQYISSIEAVI